MAPSFTRRLRQETPSWVRDGVVTAQQAETILARYPESGRWFQRPIVVFSVLGGALVVLAVALLVAHNWHEIPRWAKLAGVLTLLLGAHAGGLVLRARGHGLMGEGLFVLGGGLFVVGIALLGQIYNLAGGESDAVLLWWALLLPAAYVLPSIALIALGWLGASVWFWMFVLDRMTCSAATSTGTRASAPWRSARPASWYGLSARSTATGSSAGRASSSNSSGC